MSPPHFYSFRNRLNTAAAVQYLRNKLKGEQDGDTKATNEYELEGGISSTTINGVTNRVAPAKQDNPYELDVVVEEESGHVNVMCEIEEEGEEKKPAVKTVSFK